MSLVGMPAHSAKFIDEYASDSKEEDAAQIIPLNEDMYFPGMAVDYVAVQKGQHVRLHIHKKAQQLVIIMSGSGEGFLGKEKIKLVKGLVLRIPPTIPHSFHATQEKLEMLAIQTPPIQHGNEERDTFFLE